MIRNTPTKSCSIRYEIFEVCLTILRTLSVIGLIKQIYEIRKYRSRVFFHSCIKIVLKAKFLSYTGILLASAQWTTFQLHLNAVTNLQRNGYSSLITFIALSSNIMQTATKICGHYKVLQWQLPSASVINIGLYQIWTAVSITAVIGDIKSLLL